MKLSVVTTDKRFTLDTTEEQANKLFNQFIQILIGGEIQKPSVCNCAHEKSVPDVSKAVAGYKGFLYVRCPDCGKENGFCVKSPISHAVCKGCGSRFELPEKMTPIKFTCECGSHFKYLTNITDKEFDISCLDCGTPNAVILHEVDGEYKNAGRA